MNKKADEEFKHIHDEYLLQCTCTEMKDKINNLQSKIDKAIEYIENHSRFEPPYYEMREFNNNANLNELYDILKEDK